MFLYWHRTALNSRSTVRRWGSARPQQQPPGCYSSGSPSAEIGRASLLPVDTTAQILQGNTHRHTHTHWSDSNEKTDKPIRVCFGANSRILKFICDHGESSLAKGNFWINNLMPYSSSKLLDKSKEIDSGLFCSIWEKISFCLRVHHPSQCSSSLSSSRKYYEQHHKRSGGTFTHHISAPTANLYSSITQKKSDLIKLSGNREQRQSERWESNGIAS